MINFIHQHQWLTIQHNRKRENKLIRCTAAQKNHNLQQYLQNRLSTLLNREINFSCLFLITHLAHLSHIFTGDQKVQNMAPVFNLTGHSPLSRCVSKRSEIPKISRMRYQTIIGLYTPQICRSSDLAPVRYDRGKVPLKRSRKNWLTQADSITADQAFI